MHTAVRYVGGRASDAYGHAYTLREEKDLRATLIEEGGRERVTCMAHLHGDPPPPCALPPYVDIHESSMPYQVTSLLLTPDCFGSPVIIVHHL